MLKLGILNTGKLPETLITDNFTTYRNDKLQRLKDRAMYKVSCGAELLLQYMAGELGHCVDRYTEILVNENGKPYPADHCFCFNISHSGTYCACAVADFEIGVDIQEVTPLREAVVKRFFSAAEAADIHHSQRPDIAFTELWAQKEAVIKLWGDTVFRISNHSLFEAPCVVTSWLDGYCLALATEKPVCFEIVDYTEAVLERILQEIVEKHEEK